MIQACKKIELLKTYVFIIHCVYVCSENKDVRRFCLDVVKTGCEKMTSSDMSGGGSACYCKEDMCNGKTAHLTLGTSPRPTTPAMSTITFFAIESVGQVKNVDLIVLFSSIIAELLL